MSNVIQLHSLTAADAPEGKVAQVARLDCETFEVENIGGGRYIVRNRTHFFKGQRVVLTLDEVRRVIRVA